MDKGLTNHGIPFVGATDVSGNGKEISVFTLLSQQLSPPPPVEQVHDLVSIDQDLDLGLTSTLGQGMELQQVLTRPRSHKHFRGFKGLM